MQTIQRYIPKGSRKVADKLSDAVVYLSEHTSNSGKPRFTVIAYCGKRGRPDFHEHYGTAQGRERRITEYFVNRRAHLARRKPEAKPRNLYVGAILCTHWGYDQTNVEFFQVTALIGERMVEVREIMQAVKDTGWCQHDCAPVHDEFIGPALRRKVSDYDGASVKIDDVRRAYVWTGNIARATSYA